MNKYLNISILEQIDEIKSEARLALIKQAHKKIKGGKRKADHGEYGELFNGVGKIDITHYVDVPINTYMETDLAHENMMGIFG